MIHSQCIQSKQWMAYTLGRGSAASLTARSASVNVAPDDISSIRNAVWAASLRSNFFAIYLRVRESVFNRIRRLRDWATALFGVTYAGRERAQGALFLPKGGSNLPVTNPEQRRSDDVRSPVLIGVQSCDVGDFTYAICGTKFAHFTRAARSHDARRGNVQRRNCHKTQKR